MGVVYTGEDFCIITHILLIITSDIRKNCGYILCRKNQDSMSLIWHLLSELLYEETVKPKDIEDVLGYEQQLGILGAESGTKESNSKRPCS